MSAVPASDSGSYISGSEFFDPFDLHRPMDDLAALFDPNAYNRAGPGGNVDGLGPPVSTEVKEKVRAIDPCKGHCLITNATPDSGIKYTHCLPMHLYEESNLIHRLEWYWGMRMNELDLNTEYNIFPVSAQLSAMHEYPRRAPSWFLMPEDHIIDMFFSRIKTWGVGKKPCEAFQKLVYSEACRGNLPELKEKTYKYRLFPMRLRMEGTALFHVRHPPIHRAKISDYTFAVYPFDNLPWVTSHLDPKFVIMEAGRKLNLMDGWKLKFGGIYDKFFNSHPSLRRLLLIYEAWSERIPAEAYKDPGFVPLAVPPKIGPSKPAEAQSGRTDIGGGGPCADNGGWDPSSIVQWSTEAAVHASPHDMPPEVDSMETDEDSDAQDSKYDFVIGAGSRTPPRRLILSKDGKHWY